MPSDNSNNSKPTVATPLERGGLVRPVYMDRSFRVYAVHENELTTLSHLNTLALIFFSIASSLLTFSASIWVAAAFQQSLTTAGTALTDILAPAAALLSLLLYCCGGWSLYVKKSTLNAIRQEARSADQ